tara:strand:+ start:7124 stop:7633 length:510 start_codon:yes stop_codon:yes gene_type:complete
MKIAIYGPMCSGKTTVANILQETDKRYSIYSFGQKIKDIAKELFQMEGKDRSLLINIADKMREIDEDVWAKYTIRQTDKNDYCIIDDLRFQNELKYLTDWKIICLTTPKEARIQRLKKLYPDNFKDHIKNMDHISENDTLELPVDTIYINTDINMKELKEDLLSGLKLK